MSNIIDSASVPGAEPVIITITGDAGRGKTSLAALFPKPIFIQFEKGLQAVPAHRRPKAFPLVESSDQVYQYLNALLQEEHDFKTLVIDSVSTAERMFTEEILRNDSKKPKNLQQAAGGYGAGFGVLVSMHARIRKAASLLAERRGMNVVFIAHADTIRIEPPNEEAFTSYALRLDKRTAPFYIDEVDLVGFLKLETTIVGEDGERKKAISDGTRVLITYATAENVSKNRFGITQPIIVKPDVNPLEKYIPILAQQSGGSKTNSEEGDEQ